MIDTIDELRGAYGEGFALALDAIGSKMAGDERFRPKQSVVESLASIERLEAGDDDYSCYLPHVAQVISLGSRALALSLLDEIDERSGPNFASTRWVVELREMAKS